MEIINLKPEDIIVVRYNEEEESDYYKLISKALREFLPQQKIIFLGENLKIQIIRTE